VNSIWLTRAPRSNARLRLFCLPYAGGGSSIFRNWQECLAPSIDPVPIQLPGRDARLLEKPNPDVHAVVEMLSEALEPYLDRPFALFGHSLGALISFELCRRLRLNGCPAPVRLFVSAFHAPQNPRRGKTIHHLSDSEFLEELRELGGTPEAVLRDRELMQILLPIVRSDFQMHETYAYRESAPLDCPISAFGGLQDRHVPEADLRAWRAQTSADFSLKMFPGDHFFLHTARKSLLRWISDDLQVARTTIGTKPQLQLSF
jgi:medium-chain acyl-[acyl-carrier-protein] hydrolase